MKTGFFLLLKSSLRSQQERRNHSTIYWTYRRICFTTTPTLLNVNNLFCLFQELQRKIRIPVWKMIN